MIKFTMFALSAVFLAACNAPCEETTVTTGTGSNEIKRVKKYSNCNDSTSYHYTEFWLNELHHIGQVEKGMRQGVWVYYGDNYIASDNYVDDTLSDTKFWTMDPLMLRNETKLIDDSFSYQVNYFHDGRGTEEGMLQRSNIGDKRSIDGFKVKDWVEIDDLFHLKHEGHYGKIRTDTTYVVDEETWDSLAVLSSYLPKIGYWKTTNLQTNEVDSVWHE